MPPRWCVMIFRFGCRSKTPENTRRLRPASEPEDHHAPSWWAWSRISRGGWLRVGSAGRAHVEGGLFGAAAADEETTRRLLPHVSRRHGDVRRACRDAGWPGVLRRLIRCSSRATWLLRSNTRAVQYPETIRVIESLKLSRASRAPTRATRRERRSRGNSTALARKWRLALSVLFFVFFHVAIKADTEGV